MSCVFNSSVSISQGEGASICSSHSSSSTTESFCTLTGSTFSHHHGLVHYLNAMQGITSFNNSILVEPHSSGAAGFFNHWKKKKNMLSSCFYSVQTCQLVGLSVRILEKGAEELGFAIFLISNYPKLPPGHHFPESFRAKSIVSPCTSSEIFWMFSQVPPTHSQKVKSISGRAGACFNFIVCVYSTAYLSLYFSK